MDNKAEYKTLNEKLSTLKDLIKEINFGTVTLINASALVERKLRNNDLSHNEISALNGKLDKLLKTYSGKAKKR
jgi:hypothetical protein